MFLSDVNLSMIKPRYKLMDTFLFLMEATGARFWRLSRCGVVYPDQNQFHRRPSRCQPSLSSVSVWRRRRDLGATESSSLDDELAVMSSGGKSISGTGHFISVSLRNVQTCSSDTLPFTTLFRIGKHMWVWPIAFIFVNECNQRFIVYRHSSITHFGKYSEYCLPFVILWRNVQSWLPYGCTYLKPRKPFEVRS